MYNIPIKNRILGKIISFQDILLYCSTLNADLPELFVSESEKKGLVNKIYHLRHGEFCYALGPY